MENNINMENNTDEEDILKENNFYNFANIMKDIKNTITPEYLEQCRKDAYKEDREYPENFSNWYPHIKDFGNFKSAEIISNQIFTLEEADLFRTEITEYLDFNKLNEILKPTLDKMKGDTLYSIKNGCFSNKFDFSSSVCTKSDLAHKLWEINYWSSMLGTGGYTELVVRQYLPTDTSHNLTIYNGMPLRTEVRVFYNMDTKEIEYVKDYWDYDYCSEHMNSLNDKIIFDIFHNKIEKISVTDHYKELEKVVDKIYENIDTLKFDDSLKGIWSIDFMYNRDLNKIYLVDMAKGFRSAYWDINELKPETREKLLKE